MGFNTCKVIDFPKVNVMVDSPEIVMDIVAAYICADLSPVSIGNVQARHNFPLVPVSYVQYRSHVDIKFRWSCLARIGIIFPCAGNPRFLGVMNGTSLLAGWLVQQRVPHGKRFHRTVRARYSQCDNSKCKLSHTAGPTFVRHTL